MVENSSRRSLSSSATSTVAASIATTPCNCPTVAPRPPLGCCSGASRLPDMTFTAATDRYDSMKYRRSGRSGLKLPEISLGLWHNFGHERPYATQREICRRAFDLGVTHFDLANNYG